MVGGGGRPASDRCDSATGQRGSTAHVKGYAQQRGAYLENDRLAERAPTPCPPPRDSPPSHSTLPPRTTHSHTPNSRRLFFRRLFDERIVSPTAAAAARSPSPRSTNRCRRRRASPSVRETASSISVNGRSSAARRWPGKRQKANESANTHHAFAKKALAIDGAADRAMAGAGRVTQDAQIPSQGQGRRFG